LSTIGHYLRRRLVAPRAALLLGLPALVGSWIGGSWVKAGLIPEVVQLGLFSAAALLDSWLLCCLPLPGSGSGGRVLSGATNLGLAGQGFLVGLLTGVAGVGGVGGGFAIVPALVLLAGLPMPLATGTSLVLIFANALVALLALGHWPAAHLPLLLPLVGGGAIGALIGQTIAPRLPERMLRLGFSVLLIGSALLTCWEASRRLPITPGWMSAFPARIASH